MLTTYLLGSQYLEALVEDNVDFISEGIREVVEDGIITEDGKKREVDAIICATGFAGYAQPVLLALDCQTTANREKQQVQTALSSNREKWHKPSTAVG